MCQQFRAAGGKLQPETLSVLLRALPRARIALIGGWCRVIWNGGRRLNSKGFQVMLAQLVAEVSLPRWEIWVGPVAGLFCAGLVVVGGRLFFGSRRAHQPDPLEEQGKELAARYQAQASPKRRKTARGKGTPVRIFVSDAEAKAEPFSAYIQNRSIGGLCVSLVQPVQVGTILSVRPAKEMDENPWHQVEVKYCRRADDGYEMGCQFLGRPNWNMLMKFQ